MALQASLSITNSQNPPKHMSHLVHLLQIGFSTTLKKLRSLPWDLHWPSDLILPTDCSRGEVVYLLIPGFQRPCTLILWYWNTPYWNPVLYALRKPKPIIWQNHKIKNRSVPTATSTEPGLEPTWHLKVAMWVTPDNRRTVQPIHRIRKNRYILGWWLHSNENWNNI